MHIEWQNSKDPQGNTTREFSIQRDGQRDVFGTLWVPEKIDPTVPLMCFGHGGSGDRYQTPICSMAKKLNETGMVCLSIDGPVHGRRALAEGHPQANFMKHYMTPNSLDLMEGDWNTAVAVVMALPEVGVRKLAYWGLSMGTMFGLQFLAGRDDVVLACLGLAGADSDKFPHGKALLAHAAELSCPVFYLMQWDDEIINRERYFNLFDAVGSDNKRMHVNPGAHASMAKDEIQFTLDFILGHSTGRLGERECHMITA